ncbi:uncharacterized protein LOC111636636 [Centruroides sculpturatus]|uniref:uncharacterized protein LOC111636636 n=1 Tax=Centruroides sculpturatus TaxID=218467 RepID=UPI000C6EFE3E|nr:uncharacterized protein LOC111636636 [Centruroides sculpturatus]
MPNENLQKCALKIAPSKLTFHKKEGLNKSKFIIHNSSTETIIYKIKSSNPDAFQLHPTKGIVKGKENVEIFVTLNLDKNCDENEKFQILLSKTNKKRIKDVNREFKNGTIVSQQYLECMVLNENNLSRTSETSLLRKLSCLKKNVRIMFFLQNITLFFIVLIFLMASCNEEAFQFG